MRGPQVPNHEQCTFGEPNRKVVPCKKSLEMVTGMGGTCGQKPCERRIVEREPMLMAGTKNRCNPRQCSHGPNERAVIIYAEVLFHELLLQPWRKWDVCDGRDQGTRVARPKTQQSDKLWYDREKSVLSMPFEERASL